MANQQDYAIAYITVNGALLGQEGSFTMSRTSNAQVIKTVAGGYTGDSPGAPMCEVSIKNFVPQAGIEFDAGTYIQTLTRVKVGILMSGKIAESQGIFYEDDTAHGTDSPASYDLKFRGSYPVFV